jgi:hypothetical protein
MRGLKKFKNWFLYEVDVFGMPTEENIIKAINMFENEIKKECAMDIMRTVPLNGFIKVHERIAKVVKKWNNECWRLKFEDNNEIVNVFYPLSEDWHCI